MIEGERRAREREIFFPVVIELESCMRSERGKELVSGIIT